MHRENRFYGHAEVLARYAGYGRAPRIAGHLQHGWQPGTGVIPDCVSTRWRKLVWSSRNVEACERAGIRRVVPIGSPYLYLSPASERETPPEPMSLLAFPFHGWTGGSVSAPGAVYEEYAASLEELRREGFGPITVCMYWLEHARAELRAPFERRGFRVTRAGDGAADPTFLHRFRDLVLAHAHVTANRIATCSFYALHSGRPFFLHGPPMGLESATDSTGESTREWERQEFPTLLKDRYDGRVEAEIAERELGAEHRLAPEGLRDALEWSLHGVRRVARAIESGAWRLVRGLWRLVPGTGHRAE